MPRDRVDPGGFKPAYARAPFVFGVARAVELPGPVLVSLMSDLDGTPAANKALLHRMTATGALELTRAGRVGTYRMAGRLLTGFGAVRGDRALRSAAWDGRFHALVYDIPESRRRERDRFLVAAHEVGYRTVRPGLLIGPTDELDTVGDTSGLGVQEAWMTFPERDVPDLVARAWRLGEFRAEYDHAVAALQVTLARDLERSAGAEALRTMFEAKAMLTGLLLRDGALPAELTPPDWPAARVRDLVRSVEDRLWPAVLAHVDEVVRTGPHTHLVVSDESWPA